MFAGVGEQVVGVDITIFVVAGVSSDEIEASVDTNFGNATAMQAFLEAATGSSFTVDPDSYTVNCTSTSTASAASIGGSGGSDGGSILGQGVAVVAGAGAAALSALLLIAGGIVCAKKRLSVNKVAPSIQGKAYRPAPTATNEIGVILATSTCDYYSPGATLDELMVKTRQLLGALIAAPQLTDALLQRPPFRFLHDVISAVTRATGFAEGLFRGNELSAAALKDGKAREAYLSKLVCAIEEALGETLGVRPEMMLRGEEPEQTNLFLQALTRAAAKGGTDVQQTDVHDLLGPRALSPPPSPPSTEGLHQDRLAHRPPAPTATSTSTTTRKAASTADVWCTGAMVVVVVVVFAIIIITMQGTGAAAP